MNGGDQKCRLAVLVGQPNKRCPGKCSSLTLQPQIVSGSEPLDKFEYSDSVYYKFKQFGYELCFSKDADESTHLAHVTLYNEAIDGYTKYDGNIPFGIDWDKCKRFLFIFRKYRYHS